jgi:hypothetical protein
MAEAQERRRTLLEVLRGRTDAEVAGLALDRLVFDLDLLFDKVLDCTLKAKVAANELRATQRLRRLAEKHEDDVLAEKLAEDEAYLAEVVPLYRQRESAAIRSGCATGVASRRIVRASRARG